MLYQTKGEYTCGANDIVDSRNFWIVGVATGLAFGYSDSAAEASTAAGVLQRVHIVGISASDDASPDQDAGELWVELLGALDTDISRLIAATTLEPLVQHDRNHGSELVATTRAWLENDARLDSTAAALGVHRHTVRARIAQVERVLSTDLSSFPARAELWAALQIADL